MNPLQHLLIAWLIANIVETDVRTRRFALIAGVISDIDGFPVLFDQELFRTYHHTFGHTLVFGIAVAAVLALFLRRKKLGFSILLLAFAAHLGCDISGTWVVPMFAPFVPTAFSISPFVSTDVIEGIIYPAVLILSLVGAIAVLVLRKRTPMEFLSERYDRMMVNFLILPFTAKCHICGKRAFFRCEVCNGASCIAHTAKKSRGIACVECARQVLCNFEVA